MMALSTIDDLIELGRQRQQILSAEIRLGNQLKANERWAIGKLKGKRKVVMTPAQIAFAQRVVAEVNPILAPAERAWRKERRALDRQLRALARTLSVWPWVEQQRGIGPLGLALIVGAAGDLSGYSAPSKLWKRLGLAVLDGERQRRIKGSTAAKKAEALRHGFSPRRRALAHVIADALVKQNDGIYRALYDERKAIELARLPTDVKKGRQAWADRRAQRFMVKRFLLHLWCVWNGKSISQEKAA